MLRLIAEENRRLRTALEISEDTLTNHPRVKEWLDYVLQPKKYFSPSIEEVYAEENYIVVRYWTQSGVDWESIAIDVLESDEPIADYYIKEKLKKRD